MPMALASGTFDRLLLPKRSRSTVQGPDVIVASGLFCVFSRCTVARHLYRSILIGRRASAAVPGKGRAASLQTPPVRHRRVPAAVWTFRPQETFMTSTFELPLIPLDFLGYAVAATPSTAPLPLQLADAEEDDVEDEDDEDDEDLDDEELDEDDDLDDDDEDEEDEDEDDEDDEDEDEEDELEA